MVKRPVQGNLDGAFVFFDIWPLVGPEQIHRLLFVRAGIAALSNSSRHSE